MFLWKLLAARHVRDRAAWIFVGHKGHNSKGCNLHCCAEAIVSKNASKLASLWRNWEASSNDIKDANFTWFQPISFGKLATKDSNYISELLHIPRNCFDPSKSSKDWTQDFLGEFPHKSNLGSMLPPKEPRQQVIKTCRPNKEWKLVWGPQFWGAGQAVCLSYFKVQNSEIHRNAAWRQG